MFENNSANIGGAIYGEHGAPNSNNIFTIINSTFIGNQALPYNGQYYPYSRCNGGAIFAYGASIFISDSTFISNIASNKGGAFALHNSLPYGLYQVTINNSELANNIAQKGGALWWTSTRTDIEINASRFGNNSAHSGGVVYIDRQTEGRAVLSNNRFTANNATKGGVLTASAHDLYFEHETIDIIIITKSIFESNIGKHDGGVFYLKNTRISLTDSSFIRNQANSSGDIVRFGHGGVFYTYDGTVLTVARATFIGNTATFGGVHWAGQFANVSYINATFDGNSVHIDGGVFHVSHHSYLNITGASFSNNRANNFGGVIHIDQSETNIKDSKFYQNLAGNDGGVMQLHQSTARILNTVYIENHAENEGGVYHTTQSTVIVSGQTSFAHNKARTGGVVWADRGSLAFTETLFVNNTARIGGVMVIDRATVSSQTSRFINNHANYSSLYITESIAHWSSVTFVNNTGSLCALESTVTLTDMIMTNMQPFSIQLQKSTHKLHEGGAITAFQSKLIFDGKSYFTRNHAHSGGAIQAIETKIHVHGTVTIANNSAVKSGGGADIYQSEVICRQGAKLKFLGNNAAKEGGALCAIGSSIKVKLHSAKSLLHTILNFESNRAEKGGALFLAMDAKMYLLKSEAICLTKREEAIKFTANVAKYGGAVYVSDKVYVPLPLKTLSVQFKR